MTGRRRASRRAFTLLESVIALAMLAMALGAFLQVRSQVIASRIGLGAELRRERNADAIFEMVINRLAEAPTADDESALPIWTGEYLGRPYTVRRTTEAHDNPARAAVAYNAAAVISVARYDIEYDGRTTSFVWYR